MRIERSVGRFIAPTSTTPGAALTPQEREELAQLADRKPGGAQAVEALVGDTVDGDDQPERRPHRSITQRQRAAGARRRSPADPGGRLRRRRK